jgi:hypothetical protein
MQSKEKSITIEVENKGRNTIVPIVKNEYLKLFYHIYYAIYSIMKLFSLQLFIISCCSKHYFPCCFVNMLGYFYCWLQSCVAYPLCC